MQLAKSLDLWRKATLIKSSSTPDFPLDRVVQAMIQVKAQDRAGPENEVYRSSLYKALKEMKAKSGKAEGQALEASLSELIALVIRTPVSQLL